MLSSTTLMLAALASTAAASKAGRTYAVNYFYGTDPLVTARMDPIINPGVPSGHAHMVMGGNAFGVSMTDNTASTSTCTNSLVKNDKSNYWVPQLYFHNEANNSFESVPMFYMKAYYYFEETDDAKIEPFVPGLKMVSGNPNLRSPPSTGGKSILDTAEGPIQPVQFTCPRSSTSTPLYPADSDGLHGVGMQDPQNAGAGVGFSDKECDGYASPLRADIHFPSCYNPDAGPDDFKNNMAWPSSAGATGGAANCPSTHPVHTPHLFYEVYWNTPLFVGQWTPGQGKQPFVLAQGDPTGYGLHADFINGWDTATLEQVIENCNSGNDGMNKCPGLIGGVYDPSERCTLTSPIPETVLGDLSKLPGCNPLTGYGAVVTPSTNCDASTVVSGVVPDPAPVAGTSGVISSAAAGPSTMSTMTTSALAPAVTGTSPAAAANGNEEFQASVSPAPSPALVSSSVKPSSSPVPVAAATGETDDEVSKATDGGNDDDEEEDDDDQCY